MNRREARKTCLSVWPERCFICQDTPDNTTIDTHHLYGHDDEWGDRPENLRPVCRRCHMRIHHDYDHYEQWTRRVESDMTPYTETNPEETLPVGWTRADLEPPVLGWFVECVFREVQQ